MTDKDIGLVLRKARVQLKLSQPQMASRVGLSQTTVSKLERGTQPMTRRILRLLDRWGVDASSQDSIRKARTSERTRQSFLAWISLISRRRLGRASMATYRAHRAGCAPCRCYVVPVKVPVLNRDPQLSLVPVHFVLNKGRLNHEFKPSLRLFYCRRRGPGGPSPFRACCGLSGVLLAFNL